MAVARLASMPHEQRPISGDTLVAAEKVIHVSPSMSGMWNTVAMTRWKPVKLEMVENEEVIIRVLAGRETDTMLLDLPRR